MIQYPELEQQLTRLPRSRTSFVARERELATLVRWLEDPTEQGAGIVTLTGAPGAGKTRLAMEAASLLAARGTFADVGFADFSGVAAHDIARVLSVVEAASQVLSGARVLLIIDNFETVLEAATDLAKAVERNSTMRMLITSLRPLGVYGEHHVPVRPLDVPPAQSATAVAVSGYPTVQLFVERARSVLPEFELTDACASAVAEICRRLDGLPLAIELAAARIKLLPAEALLQRLEDRLDVLTGGAHDLPSRHRSLRAAIDWSYELLNPDQQRVLRCLAVFAGGFDLAAAEAVLGTRAAWMLDCVQALLDNGLLSIESTPNGEPLYRMLQTVREYSMELLSVDHEAEAVRRRYEDYFVHPGAHHAGNLTRLAPADHTNLRHALESVLADNLERSRQLHDRHQEAVTLDGLGGLATAQGAFEVARAHYSASARIFDDLDDQVGVGIALLHLGQTLALDGQRREARQQIERAIGQLSAAGQTAMVVVAFSSLGHLAFEEANVEEALECFVKALRACLVTHEPAMAISPLEGVATLAVEVGRFETAALLFALAARLRDVKPATRSQRYAGLGSSASDAIRISLGDESFASASARGREMSLEEAVDLARALESRDATESRPAPAQTAAERRGTLSPREREVAGLIARGLTNRQISEELVITEWTADSHVRHILTKLKLRSRAQVAVWAAEHGLKTSTT